MANPIKKNQALPKLDSPLVDPQTDGPSLPWYKLLIYLWKVLGSGTADSTKSITAATTAVAGTLDVFDSKGNRIGSLTLGP